MAEVAGIRLRVAVEVAGIRRQVAVEAAGIRRPVEEAGACSHRPKVVAVEEVAVCTLHQAEAAEAAEVSILLLGAAVAVVAGPTFPSSSPC